MVRNYGVTAGMIVAAFSLGLFVDHLPKASAQISESCRRDPDIHRC